MKQLRIVLLSVCFLSLISLIYEIFFTNEVFRNSDSHVSYGDTLLTFHINPQDSVLIWPNKDQLVYHTDSTGRLHPRPKEIWAQQFRRNMNIGFYDEDTLHLQKAFEHELKKLIRRGKMPEDTANFFHELVSLLTDKKKKNEVVSFSGTPFRITVHPLSGKTPAKNYIPAGLSLLIFLSGITGLFKTRVKPSVSDTNPASSEVAIRRDSFPDSESSECSHSKEIVVTEKTEVVPELLIRYATLFVEKYGDVYEQIEKLPADLNEAEQADLLQRFVEMAVHAHSFHRLGRQNAWKTLESSPNARLILNLEQEPGSLKPFIEDPEKTDRKFRYFVKIISLLNIKSFNAFLRDEIEISPENLQRR